MATLVKEKRREKKKPKEKVASKKDESLPLLVSHLSKEEQTISRPSLLDSTSNKEVNVLSNQTVDDGEKAEQVNIPKKEDLKCDETEAEKELHINILNREENHEYNLNKKTKTEYSEVVSTTSNVHNLGTIASVPNENTTRDLAKCTSDIKSKDTSLEPTQIQSNLYGSLQEEVKKLEKEQDAIPSAPTLEEAHIVSPVTSTVVENRILEVTKLKPQCMPLEEAIRVYGGREIAEVKAMSEKEEALVEGGPVSGPEHPLVDLLSNFRLSLTAVQREKALICYNITEEEKARIKLWKVERRSVSVSETCKCGAAVEFEAVFDHAELLKEKLPAARMRLEAISKDVQESYCHHQHAALLAHCQIEHFVSETLQSNKGAIREALSLVFRTLRLSDGAPEAFPRALQRWAAALADALVDERDLRHLLFLFHHLFRQTRSVRWAARVVRMSVVDASSAARAIAVLELLLARPGLETAVECTEDSEAWEEVDVRGGAGAVREGRLRERDLCALLRALPLRALLARLALFSRADFSSTSPLQWGDESGGCGVLKCCCGTRALLAALGRAARAHPSYPRLHAALRALARRLLLALAALHAQSSALYTEQYRERILAELEACFVAGLELGGALELLPAGLLAEPAALDYCTTLMMGLHDTTPRRIETLRVDAPLVSCDVRVRAVAAAAVDRPDDHHLAQTVLEFLLQTGTTRKPACAGACAEAALRGLASVLAAHRYLHTFAFGLLADLHQARSVDAALVARLCPACWRPAPSELQLVLDGWSQRCATLLPELLALLDYTPHQGLSLETQLTLGAWLCAAGTGVGVGTAAGAGAGEWRWAALRRLRVHRAQWRLPLTAPAPAPDPPPDPFCAAYALLSSSWGHCIPLACGPGVAALCRLAAERPVDALHCLGPLMLLMAQSPESVSYTPKFGEALTLILNAGPSLVQRALGRGGITPADRLQQLVLAQLADDSVCEPGALLGAWLRALWRPALPAGARAVADAAARATQRWHALDAYVAAALQEENSKEFIADAVRHASTAPLLCEAALRGAHALELRAHTHARLADALARQRAAARRIHVDNALKEIGSNAVADELVVHRAAASALVAPPTHPAHLTLWRLFLHIYLQRAPSAPQEESAPIGLLFFSGIVKSRVMYHLKKRLQETATYHQKQTELLKTAPKTSGAPQRPARRERTGPIVDNSIFPSLTMVDLTGDKSDESSSDGEDDGETVANEASTEPTSEAGSQDTFNMICYHSAAEKLVREYARWLELGERVRVAPHHADIARFLPEQALDTAWRVSVARAGSLESPTRPPAGEQERTFHRVDHLLTPHERAVNALLQVKVSSQRRPLLSSPLPNASFNDCRALMKVIEQHLGDLQTLAQEWQSEVRYMCKLDEQLWELVGALRVRRALPSVDKSCARGCEPTTVHVPQEEWCISIGAERGIQENRRSAHAALRRLARARPETARTAATLLYLVRGVRSAEAAVHIAERAARFADALDACALAKQALTALITELADRWLCGSGARCAALVSTWGAAGGARASLCGALVAPRRLHVADWPLLYTALLAAPLPPHAAFSHLSKFEMGRWAEMADTGQRQQVLDALVAAAQTTGVEPGNQHQVLLELVGVHAAAVVTARELCALVVACARAAVLRRMPPAFCAAVARAADAHAAHLTFDQLGHLQRELGSIWWEARTAMTSSKSPSAYALYAESVAYLLQALQRAFVAAARAISYEPSAVAVFAWSSLRESWGPWVTPHPSPPLLPSTGEEEAYTYMLGSFVDTVKLVMGLCPGCEESLVRCVWEWAVRTQFALGARAAQETAVQLSALLAETARLPWHVQWWTVDCLPLALQAVSMGDKELCTWCARCWRGVAAGTWLRGAPPDAPAPALAALLALFTSAQAPHTPQTLSEACDLPWSRLPEAALDEALDRFFIEHYSTVVPYHDCAQFIVLLAASELRVAAGTAPSLGRSSREKRARGVSQWVRAACAPALAAHVREHAYRVLAVITDLAPHIEKSPGELEELLGRAIVIMCMEAAASALPVWQQWAGGCARALREACASAVAGLTARDYHASLAEAVARAQLADKESSGWAELRTRWSGCAWGEAAALVARGALHAAYGAVLARAHNSDQLRAVFHALAAHDIPFDNEPIIAVWICAACRCACADGGADARAAARALLARWAEAPRRTLLQMVALQSATASSSPRHRLLCKLAQCIINPEEGSARAYEACCASVLGSSAGDVTSWGLNPSPELLPRLALRLYPDNELYFREELQLGTRVV